MDAFVQLALIAKTNRVFATDASTFLSFPLLHPLTFSRQEFATLTMPTTPLEYESAAEFSRIVNFLPRDMVATIDSDRYLWDVYADVMARAEVATGSGSEGEESDWSSVLYSTAQDGSRTDSPAYAAFRQYRDAVFVAQQDYGARKVSGELTTDPVEKQHWTQTEEPALRAAIARAESDWEILGHRSTIEAALQAENASAARNPVKRWSDWSAALVPEIDLPTDPIAGGRYGPTGVLPRDFADTDDWLQFDLSNGEMTALVAEAPPALKAVLDDGTSGTDVERVSFEYRSVTVVRPWFRANALTSRIWRTNDPDLILSTGSDIPSGACPAYVGAVVFMRNLRVTPRAATPAAPVVTDLRFTIRADMLTKRQLHPDRPQAPRPPVRATDSPPSVGISDATRLRPWRQLGLQSVNKAPALESRATVPHYRARPSPIAAAARSGHSAALRAESPTLAIGGGSPMSSHRRLLAHAGAFRVQPTVRAPTPTEPPAPADPPLEISSPDHIFVLAFICKRLPKTPDAMPNLIWS